MDKIIKKVLEKLENEGFKAYLVGGYVRDYLLGISSFDVDICTNALPKDIKKIFNVNNENYGSCNIKIKKYNIDITTFRKEFDYENGKPSRVEYIDDLKIDLLRRDFRVNAICMDKSNQIIDPLNGCDDLNNFLIKSIGDTERKIMEDPSRMLRAIRFSSVLDFKLDDELYENIKKYSNLVSNVSKDKIKGELSKILLSKNYLKGLNLLDELNISQIIGLKYDEIVNCTDLMGMFAQISVDLPFTKEQKDTIIKIQEILNEGIVDQYSLYNYGLYVCTVAAQILNISSKEVNNIYRKMTIKSRSDIDINGKEIAECLGIEPSAVINKVYIDLETELLNNKLKNKNSELKRYIFINKVRWVS